MIKPNNNLKNLKILLKMHVIKNAFSFFVKNVINIAENEYNQYAFEFWINIRCFDIKTSRIVSF